LFEPDTVPTPAVKVISVASVSFFSTPALSVTLGLVPLGASVAAFEGEGVRA